MQDHKNLDHGSKGVAPFNSNDGKWLKLSDAAKTLGVSEITLRRRVKCGRLAFDFRGGKYYVFIPDGVEASHFLDAPDATEAVIVRQPVASPTSSSPSFSSRSLEQTNKAFNMLRPYSGESTDFGLRGPTAEQIITILKIELGEKEKELAALKRKIADQSTLIAALEASLEEFMSAQ